MVVADHRRVRQRGGDMTRRVWSGLVPLSVVLLLWAGLSAFAALPVFILPSPLAVFLRLATDAALLARHSAVTGIEVLAGLALGTVLGIAMACAMQLSPGFRKLTEPFLALTQAVPVFVLAPVLTVWLGYGFGPKIVMTVLLVFFPVTTALQEGMATVPQPTLDLAHIAKASGWREMIWLRLPHALPHLMAGLKIAATYAPTGAVIGEWIGASQGLGFLMLRANAQMQTDLTFAALTVVVALTVVLRALVWTVQSCWEETSG